MLSLQQYAESRIKEYDDLDFVYNMLICNEINYVFQVRNIDRENYFYIVFYFRNGKPYGKVMTEERYKEIENDLIL